MDRESRRLVDGPRGRGRARERADRRLLHRRVQPPRLHAAGYRARHLGDRNRRCARCNGLRPQCPCSSRGGGGQGGRTHEARNRPGTGDTHGSQPVRRSWHAGDRQHLRRVPQPDGPGSDAPPQLALRAGSRTPRATCGRTPSAGRQVRERAGDDRGGRRRDIQDPHRPEGRRRSAVGVQGRARAERRQRPRTTTPSSSRSTHRPPASRTSRATRRTRRSSFRRTTRRAASRRRRRRPARSTSSLHARESARSSSATRAGGEARRRSTAST